MLHKLPLYVLSGIGALVMAAAGVNPGDAATNLSGWAETLGLTGAADWIAGNISDTWVAAIAAVVVGFSVARWWPTKRETEAIQPSNGSSTVEEIANAWWAMCDIDPANTLIILSAGIERSRLQGNHPAWEIFFTAYNGGVGEVRLVSAGGSFKVSGQAYPTPAELKSATSAKHGEIALFTVRQWIDQQDVPQDQQGQNHVVLQLSDLTIEAIATDLVSGNERLFVVPLPDHLQFDVRHHWNIQPEYFSRFYRERFGTDDNEETPPSGSIEAKGTIQPAPEPEFINLRDAVIDAWERIRKLPEFDEPPPSLPQFDSRREYYEADPVKTLGIVAQIIFNSANPPIPIKGISPPHKVMEIIPADKAAGYRFSDDATELFDWIDQDKSPEQRRRYINLQVKRIDMERRIKAIEEDNGKG